MVQRVSAYIKANPVLVWGGVGVFCYFWKASIISTMYQKKYNEYDQERKHEILKIRQQEVQQAQF
eukprot:403355724